MEKQNKKVLVANIKMNLLSVIERDNYLKSLENEIDKGDFDDVEVIFCPPFVYLERFANKLKDKGVFVGAQDVFWEKKGTFTGEISAPMLKGLGITHCIVGHSERRQVFGENNEMISRKLKSVLEEGLTPIFCFGETRQEKEMGATKDVITKQILEGLGGISSMNVSKIIFAYEPVWAISGGEGLPSLVPTSDEIMSVRILVKKILTEKFGSQKADEIRVTYGGSVNAKLLDSTCVNPRMDGALVGGESLVPIRFMELARMLNK
jgi:triosephosphate isomerase